MLSKDLRDDVLEVDKVVGHRGLIGVVADYCLVTLQKFARRSFAAKILVQQVAHVRRDLPQRAVIHALEVVAVHLLAAFNNSASCVLNKGK